MRLQRTRLLTFLCLMTMVLSGFSLFYTVGQATTGFSIASEDLRALEEQKSYLVDSVSVSEKEALSYRLELSEVEYKLRAVDNPRPLIIISALGSLLCVGGAMFMFFRLDRKGLYMYILGCAVELGGSLIILGDLLFVQAMNTLTGVLLIGVIYLYWRSLNESIALNKGS